jgi:hypothetical protein
MQHPCKWISKITLKDYYKYYHEYIINIKKIEKYSIKKTDKQKNT